MHWKRWWQRWNIANFAPGGSHECSHRHIKNTVMQVCQDLLNQYEAKATVSWIASSLVMRCGVTTMSQSQNRSPWSGSMWIPHRRKSSRRCPQRVREMCTVFWDRKGVILLDFLEPGQTINSGRYIVTMTKLKAWISRVRPKKKTTFLLQHDSARPHTSLKTMEHTVNLGWTVVPHPPYSPDFVPSDFHPFWPMKGRLRGKHFPSNDAIVWGVKQWATSAGADFYERDLQALVNRWRKCIANGGDNVKK